MRNLADTGIQCSQTNEHTCGGDVWTPGPPKSSAVVTDCASLAEQAGRQNRYIKDNYWLGPVRFASVPYPIRQVSRRRRQCFRCVFRHRPTADKGLSVVVDQLNICGSCSDVPRHRRYMWQGMITVDHNSVCFATARVVVEVC